jgi:hypothetical protein
MFIPEENTGYTNWRGRWMLDGIRCQNMALENTALLGIKYLRAKPLASDFIN